MSIKRAFFLPIVYDHNPKTCLEKFTERVDDYFYYGGKRLHVKESKATTLMDRLTTAEKCLCLLKAISWIFPVVPLFFIISKLIVNPRDTLTDHYTDPTKNGFTLKPERQPPPSRQLVAAAPLRSSTLSFAVDTVPLRIERHHAPVAERAAAPLAIEYKAPHSELQNVEAQKQEPALLQIEHGDLPRIERHEGALMIEHIQKPALIDLRVDEDDDSALPIARAPIGASYVTKNDLARFANTKWLNDSCVNTYFEMLASDHPDVCIGNSLAIVKPFRLHRDPLCPFLKGNGKRPTSFSDVVSSIYVPLSIRNCHWALLVIDPIEKRLHYYDSLSWEPNKEVANVRESLAWLTNTSWDLVVEKSPQQINGCDCGVYVCHTAMRLMEGKSIQVTPEEIAAFRHSMHAKFLNVS